MKKCKECYFFSEPNEDRKIGLCLYFCEYRSEINDCISKKEYIEQIKYTINRIDEDMENLFQQIDSQNFKYNLFSYWEQRISRIIWQYGREKEVCKQKIFEFRDELVNEINYLEKKCI